VRRARLAPEMISTPGHRGAQKAPTWSPCQPGCHPSKTRAEPLPDDPFRLRFRDGLPSRSRPLAPMLRPQFGLAFIGSDCLARFGGLFTWRSDLDGAGAF
jgi:hypothetical protein